MGKKPSSTHFENRFQVLLENVHGGIVLYDKEGIIQYASPSVKKILGYTRKDLLGKSGLDFIHPDDYKAAKSALRKLTKKRGETLNLIQRVRAKKGHYVWVESKLTNSAEVGGIVSSFLDITKRKAAENKEREAQQLLETINKNLSEGLYVGAIGQRFLYANDAALRMLDYTSFDDLRRLKPEQLYVDDKVHKHLLEVLRTKKEIRNVEVLFYKKKKRTFWALINVSLINYKGNPHCFVGTIRDITEQKNAALMLRQSQQLLASISDNVQEGFFRSTTDAGLAYVNKGFVKLFGYASREEVMRVNPKRLYRKAEDRQAFLTCLLDKGTVQNVEYQYKRKNGEVFWGICSATLIIDADGHTFIDGTIRDITQQRDNERKLVASHKFLQNVINTVAAPIFVKNEKFQWILFNEAFLDGRKAEEHYLKTDFDFLDKKTSDQYRKVDKEVLQTGRIISKEEKFVGRTGDVRSVITTKSRYINENGEKFVIGVMNDITERKRFERLIKAINASLRAVLESSKDEIFAFDKDLRYTMFNKVHAERIKNMTGKDVHYGTSFFDVLPPAFTDKVKEQMSRAFKGEQFSAEETLAEGRVVEVTFNSIKDENSEVTGVALFAKDITERKLDEAKLKSLNKELIDQNFQLAAQEEELKTTLEELSERNFELDQLMYKTSHDLRSPLSSIMGLVHLAQVDKDGASRDLYINKIEGRIKKLDEFIKSMLNYARVNRGEVVRTEVNLEQTALSQIKELEYLDNFHSIKTSIDFKSDEHTAFYSDQLRVNIIMSNLISNAYKYYNTEAKSFLKIRIGVTSDWATLAFKDNGIGIQEEHIEKVFNMFYRATDKSQGSGLGMYIVKQAVDRLGGIISIKSKYGKGTTITVKIPNMK